MIGAEEDKLEACYTYNHVNRNSMLLLAQMISYATHMGYLILVAKIIYVVVYKADLDHKQEYDKEVLTMGLFCMECQDTI